MSFERSAAGQTNRSLFLGVDYVCYVEGVPGTDSGDDIAFWSATFAALRPELKVRFTPRGGKPVLESLANGIIRDGISKTIVAMDADYSRFYDGGMIIDDKVLYTRGYSWECDAYYVEHNIKCHLHFARCQSVPANIATYYSAEWDRIDRQSFWLMRADFLALSRKTSVIPREAPGRIINKCTQHSAKIDAKQCYVLIGEAKRNGTPGYRVPTGYPETPRVDCVGKYIALAARLITNGALRVAGQKEVGAAHFQQISVLNFRDCLASGMSNIILDHHREQIARL